MVHLPQSLAEAELEDKVTPIAANLEDLNIFVEHPASAMNLRRELIALVKSQFKETAGVDLFKLVQAKAAIIEEIVKAQIIQDLPVFDFDQY